MHREISHSDGTFAPERPLGLYLFTALLAVLFGLDLVPRAFGLLGLAAPWPSEISLPTPWFATVDGSLSLVLIWFKVRYALIAAVLGGARILYGSLQGLFEGKLGADLALAIACLAAILMNEPLVAAEVVFIGMLGECLEAFTFARTQSAIRKIVEVFPVRCWRLEDGQEVRVFTSQLQVGNRVVVKPGAKIPVDGVITDGRSAVDVSPLTGESVPLDKGPGDEVLAGSLNQFGALTVVARKVAEQTVAGKVVEMTARALKDKTSGERLADRWARWFLPAVLGLSLATFLVVFTYQSRFRNVGTRPALTTAMYPTLSVLVVACPCALILATPAAIMAALARLAGTGVLVKSGRAIEKLAGVTAIAIDKTGTLTEGKLVVKNTYPLPGVDANELLRLAASAEQPSEHPLGRAVVAEAKSRNLPLESAGDFRTHAGAGIVTGLSLGTVVVGTRRLLEEQNIAWSGEAEAIALTIDAAGQTPLWVASAGRLLGAVAAQDHPRPEAAGVIAQFKSLGIEPIVVLTGDRRAAANAALAEFGVSEIAAELLPHQKAERVDALRASGKKVAMIGDGINDAPALARADVGLALSGVDLAAEAGDIVLLGDPLRPLPLLFRLSRQTVRIIHQNILWFAFGVNFVGILFTSWLWPVLFPGAADQSPLAAVIYHQLGSLAVLLNSMRLLWFDRARTSPTLAKASGAMHDLDRWIDHAFDVHEWSHTLGQRKKTVALGLLAFLAMILGISGLTVVAPDETAIVRRFGRPVETLTAGWHWRWPWPVEDAVRVSGRTRTLEIGFRENPAAVGNGSWTWTSAHRKDNRRPDESMMITGDGNLVDIQAVLRYRVTDPHVYLFDVAGAEEILRASAEATLRGLVAGRPFASLLTVERQKFQDEVLSRLRETCSAYGEKGLGIELEGLSLLDLHPPGEVVEAYYDVAKAMERRDKTIHQAQESAIQWNKAAQAESEKIVSQAKAAATEKTYAAAGETRKFLDRSRARRELSEHLELQLSLDKANMELRGDTPDAIEKTIGERRKKLVAAQTALSDLRTYWDTIGAALSGRHLVLVDSDNVRGQRNLFLVDPEVFRPVMPFLRTAPPTKPLEP